MDTLVQEAHHLVDSAWRLADPLASLMSASKMVLTRGEYKCLAASKHIPIRLW